MTSSLVDVWFPAAGGHGAGVRGSGAAAAARTARVWHRVGGIGPTARQPREEEPLRWVLCIAASLVTASFVFC